MSLVVRRSHAAQPVFFEWDKRDAYPTFGRGPERAQGPQNGQKKLFAHTLNGRPVYCTAYTLCEGRSERYAFLMERAAGLSDRAQGSFKNIGDLREIKRGNTKWK